MPESELVDCDFGSWKSRREESVPFGVGRNVSLGPLAVAARCSCCIWSGGISGGACSEAAALSEWRSGGS